MSTALRLEYDDLEVLPGENDLPYSFGPPMDSDEHRMLMNSLVDSGAEHFEDTPDVYIAGDMAMYFSPHQIKANDFLGPDVFIVKDTTKRLRKSWVVWQEQRTPDIVIELISPTTEARDRGEKMEIYARVLRVSEYYLFDPATGLLEGYRLLNRRYRPIAPTADGQLRSAVLPIGLRVVPRTVSGQTVPWLRWTDAAGELVPLPRERADQAEDRADQAEDRADQAEDRADQAEEQAAQAQERAEHAEDQAAQAQERADQAEQQAAAARAEAARVRAEADRLAAKLRALGIDPDA